MQIVINIPKVMYINAKRGLLFGVDVLVDAIKNGTPLPKGHGRLIDVNNIGLTDFEIVMCNGDYKQGLQMICEKIDNAPTILEGTE